MSCGFDIGNRNCVIAVAQRGGVDVILNEVSQRQTMVLVGFGEKERFIGEPAVTQWVRNVKNTISQLKRLIGRKWGEQELQEELKYLPFKVKDIGGGELGVEVMYGGKQTTFSVVQVVGMFLRQMRTIAEAGIAAGVVRDVVISVPGFFTSSQRQAFLDASLLAGLNCLRLLDENTAVALSYGIYKTDLHDTDPLRVMFVDMGDSYMTASVVGFVKGKLTVLGKAYDRNLGGRNFDRVLVEHFCQDIQKRYRLDIKSNPRALLRLHTACERVKRILSANTEAPLNLEALMNDIDVRGMVSRAEFENMAKPLLDRVVPPLQQALAEAGVTPDQLHSVELIGGATRIPSVANLVSQFLGKPISRTLIAEEAVARGCALQSAILSPTFKVRPYKIEDINPYPINLAWKDLQPATGSSDQQETTELFSRKDFIPAVKVITFPRAKPFELTASYAPTAQLPPGVDPLIGRWVVSDVPASRSSSEPAKLRIKAKINLHGIFAVECAEIVETVIEEPKAVPPAAEKMETDAAAPPSEPAPSTVGTGEDDKQKSAEAAKSDDAAKKDAPAAPTTKVVKTTLAMSKTVAGLSEEEISRLCAEEEERVRVDRELRETVESKNALESLVYEAKSSLTYDWGDYATDSEKQALLAQLEQTQSWLYGEGADAKKAVYLERLQELKKLTTQLATRKNEHTYREEAVSALLQALQHFRSEAASQDPKYDHIEPSDRKKITDKCDEIEKNMLPKIEKQKAMPKTSDPVLLISDLTHARENLSAYCTPILNKPKPAPKKEEKQEEKKEEKQDQAPKNTEAKAEGSGAAASNVAQEEKETDAMDVDH